MARLKDPAVRAQLLDRAAQMLRVREPITIRSLVSGTGVSTMAVYTHFGSLPGLWSALRQEGFTELSSALSAVRTTDDPVRDLTALGVAYVSNALANPDLYRVMFDEGFALPDPESANDTLRSLVIGAQRAVAAGRFSTDTDPVEFATRAWVIGHGLASLVATGPLPDAALDHAVPLLTALYIGAGDDPARCRESVRLGWTLAPSTDAIRSPNPR
ncbi:TetR/AcrR family transcriptional regulator [Millisia brevis]|uniref:TetR/AcrR family transcriptional regulator n=1 Tax=Millisia brevis TaxID=264148 RepID=UPI00157DF945|nr:TetR-like C-terminal domain-containing protein [Millisia brevis]